MVCRDVPTLWDDACRCVARQLSVLPHEVASCGTAYLSACLFPCGRLQAAAFNAMRDTDRSAVVLADQAGSGKTLAYLLPIVQV